MAVWELVILILVGGLTLMLGATVIMVNISRVIDAKTKSRIQLQTNMFKLELEYVDKILEKYFDRIEKLVDKCLGDK